MTGKRKFNVAMAYLLLSFGCVLAAILTNAGPAVIAAVSSTMVTGAAGVAAFVYGNIKEHQAQNGGARLPQ